jgi:hypothetical protein
VEAFSGLKKSAERRAIPVRENRVIAGIAHNRLPSLNATMNKSPHIETIANISKRLRAFSQAGMICSPRLEDSFGLNAAASTGWTVPARGAYVLGADLNCPEARLVNA